MLYDDFDSLTRTMGADFFKKLVPESVVGNLNPGLGLREYQKEALGRLAFYLDGYPGRQTPTHLLFNMATGSGKTLVMAGALAYVYAKGYRNVIFFVNSTNIIEKTRDNFLNRQSSKYLFADKVVIDGKEVPICAVDNFSATDPGGINILFTTIQGLHRRMTEPRENVLTEEDFDDKDIVFLSDEAHHVNALTRAGTTLTGDEVVEKQTWEGTIDRVLRKNPRNVMLEFTATIDTQNAEIAKKYQDKLIYRYDLAQFRGDGFSKDVRVAGIDFEAMDRALGAVVLSQYRRKVAERNGLHLKPVVLMKSRAINDSKEFEERFHTAIKELGARDIQKFKTRGNDAHKKAFAFFEKENIPLGDLAREIRDDFAPEKCVSVNSKDDSEAKQLLVNSLEDKTNPIRVVFAVDKLNEGWDVLNLFDIVRLYETRDARAGMPGKTTMREAQLIGRGARYWPFVLEKNADNRFLRKFDENLDDEMRILEELHYHTKFDSRYIDEITKALVKTGALAAPEMVREYTVRVKDAVKKSRFWKDGQIFVNERVPTGRKHITGIKDIPGVPEVFMYDLHRGGGREVVAFATTGAQTVREVTTRNIGSLDVAVWQEALGRSPFYQLDSLKRYFPHLKSVGEFIESKAYVGSVKVSVRGEQADLFALSRADELDAALFVLVQIAHLVQTNTGEFAGTTQFVAQPISRMVKDKSLRVTMPDSGEQERGMPMRTARDQKTQLDLMQKDWYVYDENYGTKEEKQFVHFVHDCIDDLEKRYEEVRLLRNERLFKLYRFSDGAAIEPDFVLFLREAKAKKAIVYQLFVEPKGGHLVMEDKWKEDFLKEISANATADTLFENAEYKIIGLPFFRHDANEAFEEAFEPFKI